MDVSDAQRQTSQVMRCRYPTHQFQNPMFPTHGCLSLLEQWHTASVTTTLQTVGGGNRESVTRNRERKDKGKRVTSVKETLKKYQTK